MSQSTATSHEEEQPEEQSYHGVDAPAPEEIELDDCSFIYSVKLSRSTNHSIWNPGVDGGSRMYLDYGGLPKLILRDRNGENVLRYIPYHCLKDFTIKS